MIVQFATDSKKIDMSTVRSVRWVDASFFFWFMDLKQHQLLY